MQQGALNTAVRIFVVISRHATCNWTSNNNNNKYKVLLYCVVLIVQNRNRIFFAPNYLTKSVARLTVPVFVVIL